jgi:hypothetical protein
LPRILLSEHVISDTNQRFQYPALVRSQRYDSIVVGASDSRLLHPKSLERVFGGRFANLAFNAGRAYEQYRLAMLFIDEVDSRGTLLVGLDHVWCDEQADERRTTVRSFPEWMYDPDWRNDLRYMLNSKTVEISGRRFAQLIGMREARYIDGYEVFTPPESAYDTVKVNRKLWGKDDPRSRDPVVPPYEASAEERLSWHYPALGWRRRLPPGLAAAWCSSTRLPILPLSRAPAQKGRRALKNARRASARSPGVTKCPSSISTSAPRLPRTTQIGGTDCIIGCRLPNA